MHSSLASTRKRCQRVASKCQPQSQPRRKAVLFKAASPASTARLESGQSNKRHLEFNCTSPSQDEKLVMFWRGGFSKQDIRVFLLRLRKGRLLLSQQDEGKRKQKQQQKQPTTMENRRGVLDLGAESLLGSDPSNAKPALTQWAAKFNPAGQRFI